MPVKTFYGVDSLVARYGGEEFIIVLKASEEEASLQANIVRQQLQELNLPHEGSILKQVTFSFGVAGIKNLEKYDRDLLILTADKCLYEAKNTGLNKVIYSMEFANKSI